MKLTKERLLAYRSEKEEARELRAKLGRLDAGDGMIGNDTIMDYRKGYPQPRAVIGFDREKYERQQATLEKKIFRLEKRCEETEQLIEKIEDSMTRRIFRMVFLEDKTQERVARIIHMDRSRISRRIKEYLEVQI